MQTDWVLVFYFNQCVSLQMHVHENRVKMMTYDIKRGTRFSCLVKNNHSDVISTIFLNF